MTTLRSVRFFAPPPEGAPYTRSALPVAGFSLIEAEDLDEAVRMVSGTPCAAAHGVVELWPLNVAE